jgi:hypothetical protein
VACGGGWTNCCCVTATLSPSSPAAIPKHAISHLKVLIVDGGFVVIGSIHWSISGEEKQDNQLTVLRSAIVAAGYCVLLEVNHTEMLKVMVKKGK